MAKLGMDAHWRGVIVVAHALRDAGMEVVYLGHATPGSWWRPSSRRTRRWSGCRLCPATTWRSAGPCSTGCGRRASTSVPVVIGGTIPPSDEPALAEMGISAVFGSGTPLRTIIDRIGTLIASD